VLEERFCASHAVAMEGGLEPPHSHFWRLRAEFRCGDSSATGIIAEAVAQLEGKHLNDLPTLGSCGASAEALARFLFEEISACLSRDNRLLRVDIEEEPGCWAGYAGGETN